MSLTQTGGPGTLVNALGVYIATGDVTATGTGTNSVVLLAGNLTIAGASDVTFATLTAAVGSTVSVTGASHVTVSGVAGAGALNNYAINSGGELTLSSAVTLSALQTISFTDNTGTLELGTSGVALNVLEHIQGFQPGNSLILDGATYTPVGSGYDAASGTLTLVGTNGTPNATIPVGLLAGLPTPEYFHLTMTGGNEVVTLNTIAAGGIPACYLRGTRVTTDRGEVAVEDLAIGDMLVTADGSHKPVRWIGTRAYQGRFLANNPQTLPVLIKRGALQEGVPARDLWVSPKHAMFLRGVLVPAEYLVNGVSVLGGQMMEEVHYFHIELNQHDLIIAEGAVSETYVEDANRSMFHNADSYRQLYPDARSGEAEYVMPRLEHGFQLEAIRADIARRAQAPANPVVAAA